MNATSTATAAKQSAFIISGVHLEKSIRQRKHVHMAHTDRKTECSQETGTDKQSKWELNSKQLLSWLVQALVSIKHWGTAAVKLVFIPAFYALTENHASLSKILKQHFCCRLDTLKSPPPAKGLSAVPPRVPQPHRGCG